MSNSIMSFWSGWFNRWTNPPAKENVAHRKYYDDVQSTISKLSSVIDNIPKEKDNNLVLPKGLVSLYDHQRYGLCWLRWRELELPGGGILADEMGLGKTVMIIALIMKSKIDALITSTVVACNSVAGEIGRSTVPSNATLVVCPVCCILQWKDEINSKGKDLGVTVFHGPNRTTSVAELADSDIVLTTYHTIIKAGNKGPLQRVYWKRIVLDEAHNIRNPKTAGAQSIFKLAARHRWAVTGTPIHNRAEDFFSMVKFLRLKPFDDPKVWDSWIGMKQDAACTDARQRLLHTLGKALILRRTKQEVIQAGGLTGKTIIPPKTIKIVYVELSKGERVVYDNLLTYTKSMFVKFLEDNNQRESKRGATAPKRRKKEKVQKDIKIWHIFAQLVRLRQCAVLPHLIETMLEEEETDDEDGKLDEMTVDHIISRVNPVFDRLYESSKFKKILEDVEALRTQAKREGRPMDKVVIVSSWTSTLDILCEHFLTRNFSCVSITGKNKPSERADNMEKFNKDPQNYHICLLSLVAGGVGLNLTGGNHVFFVEPHWNPQLELQAMDRVHRFGQLKNVFIKIYIANATIEDKILGLQNTKLVLADGLLSGAKRTNKSGWLSVAQLRNLFG